MELSSTLLLLLLLLAPVIIVAAPAKKSEPPRSESTGERLAGLTPMANDESKKMLRYQLHVVTLFLAAVTPVYEAQAEPACPNNMCDSPWRVDGLNPSKAEAPFPFVKARAATFTEATSKPAEYKPLIKYLEIEVAVSPSNANASLRHKRQASLYSNSMPHKLLKIGSKISVVDNCIPTSSCELQMEQLVTLCVTQSASLPQEVCEDVDKVRRKQRKYGNFYSRIKAIYGVKSRKYMCISKESAFYASDKLSEQCLFVFKETAACKKCNLKAEECEGLDSTFKRQRFLISSFSLPVRLSPKELNNPAHGVDCRIDRVGSKTTVTMNGLQRWFLTVSDGELRLGNESNPLDSGSHWHGQYDMAVPSFTTDSPQKQTTTVVTRRTTKWPTQTKTETRTKAANVKRTSVTFDPTTTAATTTTETTTIPATTTTTTTTTTTIATTSTTTMEISSTRSTAFVASGFTKKPTRRQRIIIMTIPIPILKVTNNTVHSFFDGVRDNLPATDNQALVLR